MRIIAFITFSADIQRYWITSESRRKLPASPRHAGHRCGTVGEGVEAEPDCDLANQSPPDYPDDQRTAW